MATKKTDTKAVATETKPVAPKKALGYRITEKGARLGENNTYVFNVLVDTNKIELKRDLEKTYKVKVLAINVVNSPKKKVFSRGRFGVKGGGKKVYVTLKKGDSIVLE
jgi:large subunit ribosomal protein L23